ncbi:cytochrome b-c1 complex subunit 6-like [Pyrus ussuriensis x Pyrus communis]|uniref:Complex III subunit VI n=1 Tax=Pyrus ussuriensis x Pyrus communis TaxID=2448454 RepID=A0A5N5IIY7_9ROSA|nr:cytochrome b-c1 complex subunit 6-like [Pyrus ussuriensis x Pyrus communis]
MAITPLHNSGADLSPRITRADDELVDQKKYLEESCQPKCVKPLIEYQACVKRVEGDDTGNKHCTGQYFDYISCVDKCPRLKVLYVLAIFASSPIHSASFFEQNAECCLGMERNLSVTECIVQTVGIHGLLFTAMAAPELFGVDNSAGFTW